jgi:hypothetical protein
MFRAFGFVVSFGAVLLLASAAPGQPVCTRYENGRLYIIPGCRGPGARTVEAPYRVALTASFSEETPRGVRIARIRVTTKDLIEQFKQEFGVSGRKARLVILRNIEDLDAVDAKLYFVLDDVYYLVEDFIEPLPLSLPEGFYGSASGHRVRKSDGAISSFHFQRVSALAMGDLAVDGFTMGLFSLDQGRCSLRSSMGQDVGFLCQKLTFGVTGGMQVSGIPTESPMLVTGTLQIGPERLVASRVHPFLGP